MDYPGCTIYSRNRPAWGDGFVQRNIWALIEGMEEEITDRVLQRIITRVQGDMDRANFSHGVAEAFKKKQDVRFAACPGSNPA